MTLLGASVLFARGTNTHNQLRLIVAAGGDGRYVDFLEILSILYKTENTPAQRDKLQMFLVNYGEEIYKEYSICCIDNDKNRDSYALK